MTHGHSLIVSEVLPVVEGERSEEVRGEGRETWMNLGDCEDAGLAEGERLSLSADSAPRRAAADMHERSC